MLKQRLLTAIIALPLLMWALTSGIANVYFLIFVLCIGLSLWELANIVIPRMELLFHSRDPQSNAKLRFADFALPLMLGYAAFASYVYLDPSVVVGVVIAVLLLAMLLGALPAKDNNTAAGRALGYLLCVSYGVLPWLLIWDLTELQPFGRCLVLLLAIVWSGDTGGYFGGRFFGRHLLAPVSSPKKTWEGAVTGLFASALGGYLTNWYYDFSLGSHKVILLASVAGGLFGQLGDLVESSFKRFAGIKDSGKLFPGHGGFLDRCDGVLFAGPVIWIVLAIFS